MREFVEIVGECSENGERDETTQHKRMINDNDGVVVARLAKTIDDV